MRLRKGKENSSIYARKRSEPTVLLVYNSKKDLTHKWVRSFLVLETGIEPVRYRYRGILSPLRLPVPPLQRNLSYCDIITLAFFIVKQFFQLFFKIIHFFYRLFFY